MPEAAPCMPPFSCLLFHHHTVNNKCNSCGVSQSRESSVIRGPSSPFFFVIHLCPSNDAHNAFCYYNVMLYVWHSWSWDVKCCIGCNICFRLFTEQVLTGESEAFNRVWLNPDAFYSNFEHMFMSLFTTPWLCKQDLAVIQVALWERGLLFLPVGSCRVEDREDLWWVEHDIKVNVHLKNYWSDLDSLCRISSRRNVFESCQWSISNHHSSLMLTSIIACMQNESEL